MEMVSINLSEAYQHVKTVTEALEALRHDATYASFYNVIEEAQNLFSTTEFHVQFQNKLAEPTLQPVPQSNTTKYMFLSISLSCLED